jgi:hypothetical protein
MEKVECHKPHTKHFSKSQGRIQGGAMGPGSPHWCAWPRVHYACAATKYHVMSKQRQLTTWLNTREGEPPAKHGRQDSENYAKAVSDSSVTLDSTLLSSSSDASSCFDPGRLSSSGSHINRLESCSKPYDIGRITEFARDLNRKTCLVS